MRYYIEHDGRVRVLERDGTLTLPTRDELEVAFEESAQRELLGTSVVFGNAKLDAHPRDWPSKDDLASHPRTDPLLHAAINATLFRPVVGVVVRNGGDVLLVQPSRGVAAGHWTLPGGFVNAFEDPADGARREVLEETGVAIHDLRLVRAITYQHGDTPYPILGLAYTAAAKDRTLTPDPDEIGQARWVPVAEASKAPEGFAGRVLAYLAQEGLL